MPVRDERDERFEPDGLRQRRVSADREVDLTRPVDGIIVDGPPVVRSSQPGRQAQPLGPVAPAAFGAHHHHHRSSSVGMRVLLVTGVALAIVLPIALQHPEAPDVPDAGLTALLTGMALLKAAAMLMTCVAVMWRLKRSTTIGQRLGYLGGPWLMALGLGLIVSVTLPFTGALAFDFGLALLLAIAVGDERLRRGRSR